MKKTVRAIVIAAFFVLFICVFPASAHSADNAYPINTPYAYPITSDSEEWFATSSHADRVGYCQIPEDILRNMDTMALVETVADYPLLVDLLLFSSAEDAYQSVLSSFNGLQELEKRPDAVEELSAFLQNNTTAPDDFILRTALGVIMLEGNFPVSDAPAQHSLPPEIQNVFSDVYRIYPRSGPGSSSFPSGYTAQSAAKPKTPSGCRNRPRISSGGFLFSISRDIISATFT